MVTSTMPDSITPREAREVAEDPRLALGVVTATFRRNLLLPRVVVLTLLSEESEELQSQASEIRLTRTTGMPGLLLPLMPG